MIQLRVERRMLPHVPWALVASMLGVALLGIWNLASASRPPHHPVWGNQTLFLLIGIAIAFAVCLVDYRLIYRMALPIYLLNIAALIAVKVVGHKAKGHESWLALGPLRVQPAEFMKIGLILMLAKFFHDDYRPQDDSYGLVRLWKPVLITAVPLVLVLAQPDLGTAMMIFFTAFTVVLFSHVKKSVWVAIGLALAASFAVVWNDYLREDDNHPIILRHRLKHHQSQRISSWLDPESDLRGANYHSAQSKIAVGSGGLIGKGWGHGTQTGLFFLPEQHTDFIFSVWAEEHGFLACLLLLAMYGVILILSLGVAYNSRDRFGAFTAVGVTAMLFWQVFENIAMVIGLLPVTGITLPLMSYGGSSIVSVLFGLGLLANIGMRRHIF
jgi:rod shape determining protein RodA